MLFCVIVCVFNLQPKFLNKVESFQGQESYGGFGYTTVTSSAVLACSGAQQIWV